MGSITPYQRLIEFQQLSEQPASGAARLGQDENADFSTFAQVLQALSRNWKPIAICSAIGLTLGLAGALLQKPVYRAKTVVEMQIPNEDFLNRRQMDPNSEGGPLQFEPYLQTQLRLLESDGLLWSAAVKSGLMNTQEYAKLTRGLKLETIHGNLSVRLAGQTRIVEIAFEGKDPQAAANFANQLVQSYRELVQGRRLAATRQTVTFLETQIAERKQKTDAAQERLRAYVMSHGMSSIERESAAETRLRDLQAALALAEATRAQEQSVMEQAEKTTAEAASENSDHEALRTYRVRLMDLNAKRAEAVQTLKPNHYKVKQLDAEISEVDGAYQRERAGLLRRLQGRFDAAVRKESLMRGQVAQQNAIVAGQASYGVQYHALKMDFDQQRAAYDEALRKYNEANSSASVIADNVLLLDTAGRPEVPVRPKKSLTVALGAFFGLFVGLIAAFGKESRAQKVMAQANASASLGAPQLGIAPPAWIDAPAEKRRRLSPAESRERYALWNHRNPSSAHAEAYRSIVTSLMFASERAHDGHLRVVVTSAHSGEGRTTAAVNLATAIAETGCRVLLIDANRGKQALHEIFDAPDTTGFFQALVQRDGLTAPVFAAGVPNLFIMPAGPYKDAMLDVASLRKVLDDLKDTYDVILVDAPPVLGHADARWLSRVCDGCVVVHDPRITTFHDAQTALDRLRTDRVHVFGTLLNQWSAGAPAPIRNVSVMPELKIRLRIAR
jgi:capsular exopolysaccharide synthesis family protein